MSLKRAVERGSNSSISDFVLIEALKEIKARLMALERAVRLLPEPQAEEEEATHE